VVFLEWHLRLTILQMATFLLATVPSSYSGKPKCSRFQFWLYKQYYINLHNMSLYCTYCRCMVLQHIAISLCINILLQLCWVMIMVCCWVHCERVYRWKDGQCAVDVLQLCAGWMPKQSLVPKPKRGIKEKWA